MSKAFIRELKIGDQFISSRGLRIFTVKVIDVGVYATTITGSGRWFTKKYVIDQIEKSERSRKEADKLLYE